MKSKRQEACNDTSHNSQLPIICSVWDTSSLKVSFYFIEKINGFFSHVLFQSFLEPSKLLASKIPDTRTSTT